MWVLARRRRDLTILLALVLLAACCIGGIVAGSRVYNQASRAPGELRTAATQYLDAVRAGNLDGAYQQLCAQARNHESFENFKSHTARLSGYQILGVQIENHNGQTHGFVATRLTLTDNAVTDQTVPFINEDRRWRPCEAS